MSTELLLELCFLERKSLELEEATVSPLSIGRSIYLPPPPKGFLGHLINMVPRVHGRESEQATASLRGPRWGPAGCPVLSPQVPDVMGLAALCIHCVGL